MGVRGPPLVFDVALSFGLPGTREPNTYQPTRPATIKTTTTRVAISSLTARRTCSVGDDAERSPHERVDPAEVRVGAGRHVRRRRPGVRSRCGRIGDAELAGVEHDLGIC